MTTEKSNVSYDTDDYEIEDVEEILDNAVVLQGSDLRLNWMLYVRKTSDIGSATAHVSINLDIETHMLSLDFSLEGEPTHFSDISLPEGLADNTSRALYPWENLRKEFSVHITEWKKFFQMDSAIVSAVKASVEGIITESYPDKYKTEAVVSIAQLLASQRLTIEEITVEENTHNRRGCCDKENELKVRYLTLDGDPLLCVVIFTRHDGGNLYNAREDGNALKLWKHIEGTYRVNLGQNFHDVVDVAFG